MRCRLCGFQFDPTGLACHTACPMAGRCSLICCPNCGYQVVDESKSRVARVLGRVLGRRTGKADVAPDPADWPEGAVPLSHVPEGWEVEVTHLVGMPPRRLARLGTFGVVPGERLRVIQRRPAPILMVGETELALSLDILDQIWVRPRDEVEGPDAGASA